MKTILQTLLITALISALPLLYFILLGLVVWLSDPRFDLVFFLIVSGSIGYYGIYISYKGIEQYINKYKIIICLVLGIYSSIFFVSTTTSGNFIHKLIEHPIFLGSSLTCIFISCFTLATFILHPQILNKDYLPKEL